MARTRPAAAAFLLTLLCVGAMAVTERDGRVGDLVQPVRISSNSDFSVFDCDFKASEMFAAILSYPLAYSLLGTKAQNHMVLRVESMDAI